MELGFETSGHFITDLEKLLVGKPCFCPRFRVKYPFFWRGGGGGGGGKVEGSGYNSNKLDAIFKM